MPKTSPTLTRTNNRQSVMQIPKIQTVLFSFTVAAIGVVAGFFLALSMVTPSAAPVAAAPRTLDAHLATSVTSCAVPASHSSKSAKTAPKGGKGGFVDHLIGGTLNKATIENTGPYSKNIIVFKQNNKITVNNTNTISFVNTNSQASSSGAANVSDNTSAGGASSGWSSTTNHTDATISITN